jgi:hypothetical protein
VTPPAAVGAWQRQLNELGGVKPLVPQLPEPAGGTADGVAGAGARDERPAPAPAAA